ncbi:MAG: hypothetical protein J6Y25_00030 [Elusimicrobiaceae bacterium]|nr:hypothetical protein [Elusimicrobiaceae bacterium]
MKHHLFVLATVTLSSTLYAQPLTRAQAQSVFAQYNPSLVERAAQNPDLNTVLDEVLTAYLQRRPADTLANRYELIALARNFDNSLQLNALEDHYKQAVLYSALGGHVQEAALAYTRQEMQPVLARIWAVSVQVKEQLLAQYKDQARHDKDFRTQQAPVLDALQADLENLTTHVGPQLQNLLQQRLDAIEEQALGELQQQQAAQADNLQIKTKHKKPVAK